VTLLIILLILILVLAVLTVVPRRVSDADRVRALLDDNVDEEVLAEAEQSIEELEAMATPEDAEDRPDWGPGVPKSPPAG
jgi:hypothetical protein